MKSELRFNAKELGFVSFDVLRCDFVASPVSVVFFPVQERTFGVAQLSTNAFVALQLEVELDS